MSYVETLQQAADAAIPALRKLGVDERFTSFKPNMEMPARIVPPSQSDSKFQAEQALGDWAEGLVRTAINAADAGVRAVHYGDNNKAFAEDDGFRDSYIASVRRTYVEGKRSDLLLLRADSDAPDDCTNLDDEQTSRIVRDSLGGLEVRSSRLTVEIYKRYQKDRLAEGKKISSAEPNITVKIEDLFKVHLWNIKNAKPQAYIQVFFDHVYGISFLDILKYIGTAKLRVEKHKRSDKTTIMIPVGQAKFVGTVAPPEFDVVHNITRNGRHDIFARPRGGNMLIDAAAVRNLLK